ncbi:hypothetical protein AK830_g10583 [Neonectria ditissima]|uniref:Gfo/Idh/MocA-like oxidoreductase N-terminal domain-containing protein n=1 Tax=Neonectria ditissima TaxID=78410 RepID=A0A0P7AT83_9HYPO|nr:hypothetical protein AK830_g10583 [Neonectria ditissima]
MAPIGVALIGGGIFAKEQHMPAILKCDSLTLKAIYSRSLKSAQDTAALNTKADAVPELYSGDSDKPNDYASLLLRKDIDAVIIALPIVSQPAFIQAALAAGKHVLSEKPIASGVKAGKELIDYYRAVSAEKGVTFSVAENFRFTPSFLYAAGEAGKLGKVTHFAVRSTKLMEQSSKWYGTAWRREPEYQGGFLLDGGVHDAAATRMLLGAAASRPAAVRAVTALVQPHLPPIDSASALVQTTSGATGTVQLSCGSHLKAFDWEFGFERGSVKVNGQTVRVKRAGDDQEEESVREFEYSTGVAEEVAAWAAALVSGTPDARMSPEEALADVEFLERMFVSGQQDGAAQTYELQI